MNHVDIWNSCKGIPKGSMFLGRLKPNGFEGYVPMKGTRLVRVKRKARRFPSQSAAKKAAQNWAVKHHGAKPPSAP